MLYRDIIGDNVYCKWLVKNGGTMSPVRKQIYVPILLDKPLSSLGIVFVMNVSWLESHMMTALLYDNIKMAEWIRYTYGDIRPTCLGLLVNSSNTIRKATAKWVKDTYSI
jgi:hypothetical protein